ncbi:hypothetical protein [Gimesia algae]|uniref:Uncharacterized protein n=1 Tax=Gimesia algae TaxID=2527971 RepID=A0A517V6A9_9PLAN|nr:hypothetical protein [Gimesia algae]QDT88535.1 hypothetical protein Pan161_01510 [Gimesia algae]
MNFSHEFDEQRFFEIWTAVRIERPVNFSLFTFGDQKLPYYLVCGAAESGSTVTIRKGEVSITRPMIITPDRMEPEFRNFFEEQEEADLAAFLLSRTAGFSNLKFANTSGPERIVSDSIEEAVAKLNRQLDDEEEEHVAILSAPPGMGGIAVMRYAAERVWESAPGNIQELRERGFLN